MLSCGTLINGDWKKYNPGICQVLKNGQVEGEHLLQLAQACRSCADAASAAQHDYYQHWTR